MPPKKMYKKTAPPSHLTNAQKKDVKKLIHNQIEDKYVDDLYSYTDQAYNTGLTTPRILTTIAQGVTVNQRIGDKVKLKSLHIRMSAYHNTFSSSDDANHIRVIVFKWKLSTFVSVPATSGILSSPSGALTLDYGTNSPYLWKNKEDDDFAILYDRKFCLNVGQGVPIEIKLNKFLGNISFEPTFTTGSGHLFIMVLNDEGIGSTPCPTIGYISRAVYEDA